jgi:predicted permease
MRKLRTLSAHRSYAILAVLTLALALGANLVVFTVVNALWLRPRPVANPDRVVMISNLCANCVDLGSKKADAAAADNPLDMVNPFMLEDFRRAAVFEGVAGQIAGGSPTGGDFRPRIVMRSAGRPLEVLGVTSQYFSVFGVSVRGRDFTADDDRPGAAPVAIISDQLWRSDFGGAADVIGTRVETSQVPLHIVGVAPPGFRGARLGEQIDVWIPRYASAEFSSWAVAGPDVIHDLDRMVPLIGVARLKSGVTAMAAERAIAQPGNRFIVRYLQDVYGSPTGRTFIIREQVVVRILAITAALVLLGGCATLMAIVLVHYERRRQELVVRLALGASRAQIVRQLATELAVIGAAGLGVAIAITVLTLRALPALSLPGGVDLRRLDLSIDWRVAAIGVLAAIVALAAAAAMPIVRFSRSNLVTGLVSQAMTSPPSSLRLRRFMLGLHVAATLVVLVAAGLFVRTVAYGFSRGPGFDVERTAFLEVQTSFLEFFDPTDGADQQGDKGRRTAALARLLDGLQALPGVEAVATGSSPLLPLTTLPMLAGSITTERETHQLPFIVAENSHEYLAAIGVRPISGRALEARDVTNGGVRPVVITASFAASLWPAAPATGREFSTRAGSYQVVGVVPDIVCMSLRSGACGRIYLASTTTAERLAYRMSSGQMTIPLTIRARGDAAPLVDPVKRLASQIFPRAIRVDVHTGRDLVAIDLGQERLGLWFFSGFGTVVLALGLGGVFGLVAYLAESKRRELGLRMALGATHENLLRRMIMTGLWPVAVGTAVGLVAAMFMSRMIETTLVGVTRLDPATYIGAAGIMLAGSVLGGLAAAWRIRRLSPLEALRAE